MSIDYRYEKEPKENTTTMNTFCVNEVRTGLTLKEGLSFEQAKQVSKHLNHGGGFGGWTPMFFVTSTYKPVVQTLS
jgi:hypothetical protein